MLLVAYDVQKYADTFVLNITSETGIIVDETF